MTDFRTVSLAAAKWWGDRLMKGDRQKFEARLAEMVEQYLTQRGNVHLENDYDPDSNLVDALQAAGVECRGVVATGDGIFPRKHSLDVFPDRLEPKEGYGNWLDPIPVKPE